MRNHIPLLLDIGFPCQVLKGILYGNRGIPGQLSYAWLSALLDLIRPRIILTCADNHSLLARYADEHRDVPVIFLQNALRDTIGSITPGTHLPLYLSLGTIEEKLFKSIRVRCRQLQPTGSVKLGLALIESRKNRHPCFDLCFISHYRPELIACDRPPLFRLIDENQKFLFQSLSYYASSHNLSLAVVCKTRETKLQTAEKTYFTNISQTKSFEFIHTDNGANEFNSYLAALSSDLIVNPASTLGFELFSAGKMVLFGASTDPALIQLWGIQHYFNALPTLVKLISHNYDEFCEHCDRLREMTISQYLEVTQKAAATIVAMPDSEYPHETVKRLISNILA
jgi:surface carbohydrate biosynthesis protein